MAMLYEHEISVRITDGFLSQDQDWNWFIRYTEENFEVELKGDTLEKVIQSFEEIGEIFWSLTGIREILKSDLTITKTWLREIDILAQFYNGSLGLNDISPKTVFSKVMCLLIYTGKIYGQEKQRKYLYFSDIFLLRNLSLRENLDLFIAEKEVILCLLDSLPPQFTKERQTFLDNINGVTFSADLNFVARHFNEFNNANCFSFQLIEDKKIQFWEERELLKMLSVSVRNGKLVPLAAGNDYINPDYTLWTGDILSHITDFFSSPAVTFITESVRYLLYEDIPSSYTINMHFTLLYDLCACASLRSNIMCSSLEIVTSFFSNSCKKEISEESYRKFNGIQQKLYSVGCKDVLLRLKQKGANVDKTLIQRLHDEELAYCNRINDITNCNEFMSYLRRKSIRGLIENSQFELLSKKFAKIIRAVEIRYIPMMFLEYFKLLMQIKSNKGISAYAVSKEIIKIRAEWRNEYYALVCAEMQSIEHTITIPKDYSKQICQCILEQPIAFAEKTMILKEADVINEMQKISDSSLILIFREMRINADFPSDLTIRLDDKHSIDQRYLWNVSRINKDYNYKFLNSLSDKDYTEELFKRIKKELQIIMTWMGDIKPLYDAIVKQNSEYALIAYSSRVRLAHITQFFPILENKIRTFGELCGIVPIQERIDMYHRLKEPDTVLSKIISNIIEMGGQLSDAADFFFIHFCMYGENGLNIRNACVHGLDYCQGGELVLALKITLTSLYMIGRRIEMALKNMESDKQEAEI